ncbi:MAG: DUF2399 domain-containing protein [Thermodesulfobacteriota bacterium]|nr:DUF2399 domain-containing protein [Thermodesulfobacteriota bacterium]
MVFMEVVFRKIARRYELKGSLSGTMKLGQHLDSDELSTLANFFGLDPLRVNSKEEVRLYFTDLLRNGSEAQWLIKIGDALGYPLEQKKKSSSNSESLKTILASLLLAYPDLQNLIAALRKNPNQLRTMLKGNSRESVKKICFTTAEIVTFLTANKKVITVSDLGAKFYNNSKALRQGELHTLLVSWLALCRSGSDYTNDAALFAEYHVIHDRLTVNAVLYGPVIYEKNGIQYDWIDQLYRAGEAATIGWSNIQNIEKISFKDGHINAPDLITCENEAPLTNLIQQKTNSCLLFTSGFPSSAVQKLYQLLSPQAANCYHWGDSDPAGLRIAAIMYALHPLQLYRCDLATLRQLHKHLLPLTQKQKNTCLNILATQPDFPFREELLFCVENGWLEQESWRVG